MTAMDQGHMRLIALWSFVAVLGLTAACSLRPARRGPAVLTRTSAPLRIVKKACSFDFH